MQLSRRADYGVRAMMEVAGQTPCERATVASIARNQTIPAGFLKRIVAELVGARLLVTQRGEGGGVWLARPAESISVLDIVEALDGPIYLNRCLIRPHECPQEQRCPVHGVWCEAQRDLRARLGAARLSDLAERARELAARRA